MGVYDTYGKEILGLAIGNFNDSPEFIFFGGEARQAGKFKIDGTIGNTIAVEVESRANKQVRGAIIDLLEHNNSKKLLILIPAYNNQFIENQCNYLFERYAPKGSFKVITLKGIKKGRRLKKFRDSDIYLVRSAIEYLRH